MYPGIIVHDNEHMAQLIGYARMNGMFLHGRSVVWSSRRNGIRTIFLKTILWELSQFAFGQVSETDLRALQDYFRIARDPGRVDVKRGSLPTSQHIVTKSVQNCWHSYEWGFLLGGGQDLLLAHTVMRFVKSWIRIQLYASKCSSL
jgi:hypothetical protein